MKQYLFGYGSLINLESRTRCIPKGDNAFPVNVDGFQRSWSYRCKRRDYTAVTVHRVEGKTTNGVLIRLDDPERDLSLLDDREINYSRGLIPLESIMGSFVIPEDSLVWVYENFSDQCVNHSTTSQIPSNSRRQASLANRHIPSSLYPIPQSYVDCILAGCLTIGIDFATEFILSTTGWKHGDAFLHDRDNSSDLKKYVCRRDLGEKGYFCKATVDSLMSRLL